MIIPLKVKKLIESKTIALGTIGQKGPNVTPVSCCKVIDNNIIITDNFLGVTRSNILKNKKIAVVVWDDSIPNKEYGYKLFGIARHYNKGKWLDFVKKLKENKGLSSKGAVVFSPNKIIEI